MYYSADPDGRWVKTGSKSTLGDKGFVRANEDGFIDRVHTKPTNCAESPEFGIMIEGALLQAILADRSYVRRANREMLVGKHRDGIMQKAARGRPPRACEKRFDKLISKRRFRGEQCFGTLKRLFGLARTRYFGRAKTHAQLAMAASGQNLLKVANKINFNPNTPAIS